MSRGAGVRGADESIAERECSRSRAALRLTRPRQDQDHDSDTATPRLSVTVKAAAAPSSAFDPLCSQIVTKVKKMLNLRFKTRLTAP